MHVRQSIDQVMAQLGTHYNRSAYLISESDFFKLHRKLDPLLRKKFKITMKNRINEDNSNYIILSQIILSASIRYFDDGSPLDILNSHFISFTSVFTSVWGVLDVLNAHPDFKIEFLDHYKKK